MLGPGVVDRSGAVVDQKHEHPVGHSARDFLVGLRDLLRRDAQMKGAGDEHKSGLEFIYGEGSF